MKQPNIIDDGHGAIDRFMNFLKWFSISLLAALFFFVIVLFGQYEEIKKLQDKVQRDSVSVQEYKNLLLTNQE